jgi:hypothetical protein
MSFNELDQSEKDFLLELYRQSSGDTAFQVSMFEIGEALGLDKETSSKVGEDLIGWEMVEIRTLSGSIGISDEGAREIEAAGLGDDTGESTTVSLGSAPVLESAVAEAVKEAANAIKEEAGGMGLSFEPLSELMADLKSLDAQMESPRPKTAIVRECFVSLKDILESTDRSNCLATVRALLKE